MESWETSQVSKLRWTVLVIAVLVLAAAVLFAVLPYSLPVRSGDASSSLDTRTRCDNALVQRFGSPRPANVHTEVDKQSGISVVTVDNIEPDCRNVAPYRLGIAAGFLILALALGASAFASARRSRNRPNEAQEEAATAR
jgi:hypothetical protein